MTVSITHPFVSPVVDDADSNVIGPNEWNSVHVISQTSGTLLGRTDSGTGTTQEIAPSAAFNLSSTALDLASTITSGSIGSSGFIPILNFNKFGQLTSVASVAPALAAANITGSVSVPHGGTGLTSFLAYGVVTGGTTSTGPLQTVTGGAVGSVLTYVSSTALPVWSAAAAGGVTSITGNGLTITTTGTIPEPFAFENLSFSATVSGNLLTVAIKDALGNDPSSTSPCRIAFRSATASNGVPDFVSVSSALSINTGSTGASFGTSSNSAFRLWVIGFNNGGTVVPALYNASNSTTIFPINEAVVQNSVGVGSTATSAGVYYTPNGTSLSNKAIKILGYVEYNATGVSTPGTYATAPNFVQVFGPGVKKPNDEVQRVTFTSGAVTDSTTSNTYVPTTCSVSIAPTSAANLVKALASGIGDTSSAGRICNIKMSRGSTANINMIGNAGVGFSNADRMITAISISGFDKPNSTSAIPYCTQMRSDGGGAITWGAGNAIYMETVEIMG